MDNIKKDGGVFIFENCNIAIYEITDKTRDELNVELSDDEEMEEDFYNPFEEVAEAVNHAINVLKEASDGKE
jgi:hypothetical protein